jgi:6-phosphogluconolactonase (cycloisomerase 2 family)
MKRNLKLVCLSLSLCTAAVLAQAPLAQELTANTTAAVAGTYNVAIVYVSYWPIKGSQFGGHAIKEYVADNLGKLTELPGSPFIGKVNRMAVNGKYLFGIFDDDTKPYLETYEIQPNGTLHWVAQTKYTVCGSDLAYALFLDHTGSTLYDGDANPDCNDRTAAYQFFAVQKSSGKLTFLNHTPISDVGQPELSFTGNNQFAYGGTCSPYNTPYLSAFRRNSDGSLSPLGNPDGSNVHTPPTPPSSDEYYCLYSTASDPENHVAMSVQLIDKNSHYDGPAQIATFTADSSGYLNTTSTYANMLKVAGSVGGVALSMSPSGKLLAVAGNRGLQVFHFNGANPVTPYTGLLTTASINQIFWDNNNHLYATSFSPASNQGKLFVFGVTPNWHGVAPGSPYTINGAVRGLIVQPKPWW